MRRSDVPQPRSYLDTGILKASEGAFITSYRCAHSDESTHRTAHTSRLDRASEEPVRLTPVRGGGTDCRARGAFLSAEFGFDRDVRNAGYIANWIELSKADKRAFFTACSQASKAAHGSS